jgi:hypothetical protein
MQISSIRRQPRQLLLDGLFIALLAHFFITGSVVPHALVDLFRDQPQIVVSTEPDAAPIVEDDEGLPETRTSNPGGLGEV